MVCQLMPCLLVRDAALQPQELLIVYGETRARICLTAYAEHTDILRYL